MSSKSKLCFFILSISFLQLGCYPNYRWEGNISYYIDKSGTKRYFKMYYKGVQITHRGKNIIDSVYEIK